MAKERRFEVIYKDNGGLSSPAVRILQDTVTGVQYLFTQEGYAGGLTPLLNRDGTPVVGSIYRE
jgi:hypothetical protein